MTSDVDNIASLHDTTEEATMRSCLFTSNQASPRLQRLTQEFQRDLLPTRSACGSLNKLTTSNSALFVKRKPMIQGSVRPFHFDISAHPLQWSLNPTAADDRNERTSLPKCPRFPLPVRRGAETETNSGPWQRHWAAIQYEQYSMLQPQSPEP